MRKLTKVLSSTAVALLMTSGVFASSAASAAVNTRALGSGDRIITLDCENGKKVVNKLNPTTLEQSQLDNASATCVGGTMVGQPALSVDNAFAYVIDNSQSPNHLIKVEIATGTQTDIGAFVDGPRQGTVVQSLVIDHATGFAYAFAKRDQSDARFFSLDLTNANLQSQGSDLSDDNHNPLGNVRGAAFDKSWHLYIASDTDIYNFDFAANGSSAGAPVVTHYDTALGGNNVFALGFDSNNTLWLAVNGGNASELWAADIAHFSSTAVQKRGTGTFGHPENFWGPTQADIAMPTSLLIDTHLHVEAPASSESLPNTGFNGVPALVLAALLLIAGVGAVVARRRTN